MTKIKAIKKPVVIEAIQYKKWNLLDVMQFVGSNAIYDGQKDIFFIRTLEGDMVASDGDYIIKGVHEEFYPCKPDIFKETYEILKD